VKREGGPWDKRKGKGNAKKYDLGNVHVTIARLLMLFLIGPKKSLVHPVWQNGRMVLCYSQFILIVFKKYS